MRQGCHITTKIGGDPLIRVSRPTSLILLAGAAFSIIDPLLKKPKMLQGLQGASEGKPL